MIHLDHVNKYYQQGKQSFQALIDVDLQIDQGEFVAIMGQSGSGKSTLINIIGFLDEQFAGHYHFADQDVQSLTRSEFSKIRNQNVGFIFQNFKLINNQTVQENVALPLLYRGQTLSTSKSAVDQVLEEVGLAAFKEQLPKNLSGGQQQRVSIARALISRPQFLIADEPTGALDSQTSAEIIQLFRSLNAGGMTIIMVTHDPVVAQSADRIVRILDGRVVADEEVTDAV